MCVSRDVQQSAARGAASRISSQRGEAVTASPGLALLSREIQGMHGLVVVAGGACELVPPFKTEAAPAAQAGGGAGVSVQVSAQYGKADPRSTPPSKTRNLFCFGKISDNFFLVLFFCFSEESFRKKRKIAQNVKKKNNNIFLKSKVLKNMKNFNSNIL